jgi:flavin-dependent dehydrogenase
MIWPFWWKGPTIASKRCRAPKPVYDEYEVAIIGGGPAGCLTALRLARAGCTVAVLDHARRSAMLVGETLPPAATRILAEAGILERFREQGHRLSPGIVSVWGSAVPMTTDYLFSPYGDGWHIDRSRFNELLRTSAVEWGAEFFASTTVSTCMQSKAEPSWLLRMSPRGGLVCRVLVDASGRNAAKNLPYPGRVVYDRLIAIGGFVETGRDSQVASDYTLIEAVRDGWFYSALLPDSRYIVTFTTDADVYAQGRRRSAAYLDQLLAEAPFTNSRVKAFPALRRAFSAVSMQRKAVVQPNWIAVGDAAQSYDPLCGVGLLNAMKSANDAARVILEMLASQTISAERYEASHHHSFAKYLKNRTRYYSFERRWPKSRFWARRTQRNSSALAP